jgi:hypothetical protein
MTQPRKPTAPRDQPRRVVNPLDVVVLTRARLQEVMDEAVERGRLTRGDATELVADLLARGRSQADELLGDLEQLLARAPIEAARRVAGLGPEFPVTGYDDLTAGEVVRELDGMSEPDLRKVREYERANANRKSVLAAIDRKLA